MSIIAEYERQSKVSFNSACKLNPNNYFASFKNHFERFIASYILTTPLASICDKVRKIEITD